MTTRFRGTTTEVPVGRREGLVRRSVANLENLWTIPRQWLRERAGVLEPRKVALVNDAIRFAPEMP